MADANVMDNLPLEMSPGISPMAMDEDEVDEGCAQPRFLCCKTQKNLIAFLAGALLLLAGVGGLVLVLSDHPAFREVKDLVNNNSNSKNTKESPENEAAVLALRQRNDAYFRQLRDALVSEVYNDSYNPYIFLQPNSAQKRAMEWMSYKDTLHLPLPIFQNNTATATNIGNTNASDHDISEEAKTEVMHRWIQRFALTTFYYENAGFMWGLSFSDNATSAETNVTKSTWSSQMGVHECDWEFLECDDNDRVIGLYLGGTSVTLSGTLPDEIGLLSELRHLILSQNRLKGSLPSKFYDLTNLETLELNANHFVIPIDDRIQGFRNLTTLALSNNDFVGTLPSTLDKLTNLQHFEMGSNPNLGGSVVESIVHWPNLEHMDISETNVTGTIPSEFGRLSRLTSLGIWDVPLSGTIPSEVGNLVAIDQFLLGKKGLVGSLPSEIGRWSNIQFAAILEASLTGTIPSELGRWTSCHTFFLKGCLDVTGTLPTELGLMEGLQLFHVFGTPVSGTIPSEIGLLTNALDFFFHTTELSGTMPEEVCALPFKDLSANCLPISPELPPQVECDCCTDCFAV